MFRPLSENSTHVADGSSYHRFCSFATLVDGIASHYKNLSASAEKLIADMKKLSKETLRKIGGEKEKCKEWVAKIQSARDEQVVFY